VMPFALFYAMMSDYVASGIPHTAGEVFEVTGYEDGEGSVERSLLNGASYRFLMKTGGDMVGRTNTKTVVMDGFSVRIRPRIFLWNTKISRETTGMLLKEKGWQETK